MINLKIRRYTFISKTIILFSLSYILVELPIEITDNFLVYLIPFCVSIIGLVICIINFRFIKHSHAEYSHLLRIINFIISVSFAVCIIYNFPIPETSGIRCKNWTDIEMFINPEENSEQYVLQSLEISGSIYSHRFAVVKPINTWLRWHHEIDSKPYSEKWLYIDNSKGGKNMCPFPLDNSKINFERDKNKIRIIRFKTN